MIDWLNLAANALWILGCALALAVIGWSRWEAEQHSVPFRACLARPGSLAALDLAGLLFCAGLAAAAPALLQRILWAGLGLLFLGQGLVQLNRRNRPL